MIYDWGNRSGTRGGKLDFVGDGIMPRRSILSGHKAHAHSPEPLEKRNSHIRLRKHKNRVTAGGHSSRDYAGDWRASLRKFSRFVRAASSDRRKGRFKDYGAEVENLAFILTLQFCAF
jgi:hypothetical protein